MLVNSSEKVYNQNIALKENIRMFDIIMADGNSSWIMIVVLLVLFVGMMAISIIPQRKKQKEYQQMQSAIKVGTRVMTIGRLIGTVVAINTDGTLEIDIGAKGTPVIIVINREGIGLNLDAQQPTAGNNMGDQTSDGDVDAEVPTTDAPAEETQEDPVDDDREDDSI